MENNGLNLEEFFNLSKKLLISIFLTVGFGIFISHGLETSPPQTSSPPNSGTSETTSSQRLWIYVSCAIAVILAFLVILCFAALYYIVRVLEPKHNNNDCDWNNVFSLDKNSCYQGDQALATSVQRYHFRHQKQQMLRRSKTFPSQESQEGQKDIIYEYSGAKSPVNLEVENPGFNPPPEDVDEESKDSHQDPTEDNQQNHKEDTKKTLK